MEQLSREGTNQQMSRDSKVRQLLRDHKHDNEEIYFVDIGEKIKYAFPDIQKKLKELSEQKHLLSKTSDREENALRVKHHLENWKKYHEQTEQIVEHLDQLGNDLKEAIQRLEQKDPETRKWEMMSKAAGNILTQEDPRSGIGSLDLTKLKEMQESLNVLSRRARDQARRFAEGIEKQDRLWKPLKKDIGTKVFEIARRNFLKYHLDNTKSAEHEMQTEKLERSDARNLFARMVSDGGAIVSDVDHTLIDSKQRDRVMIMPKGFIESAERLVNENIPIAIVTGRTIDSTIISLKNGGATQALIDKLEIYGEYGATYRGPSSDGKIITSDKRLENYIHLAKELMNTIERRISENHELKEFTNIAKGDQPLIRIRRKMLGGSVKCGSLRDYLEGRIQQGASINVEEKGKFVYRKLNEIISSVLKEKEDYNAFCIDNNATGIEIRSNADTKGTAAVSLVKRLQLKSVVFYGDDMPDLDVPKALLQFIAVNKYINGYISNTERDKRFELLKKAISSLTPEDKSLAPMENEIQARIEQYPQRNQFNEEFLSLHKNTLQSQAFVGVKHPQGMPPTEAAITEASSIMLEGPGDALDFIKEMTDEIIKTRKVREYEAQSNEQVGDQRELARVNRLLYMKGPTELRDAYLAKWQVSAEKFAAAHGVSVEEYNQMCQQRVEKLVEGTRLWMRRKSEILATILESGRIKTFFETNCSDVPWAKTADYLAIRTQTEKQIFGYDPETKPEDRPVYVYLSHSPDGADPHHDQRLDTYGPVAIRLKDSLRERTSFTLSGSRSANKSGTEVNLVPSPLIPTKGGKPYRTKGATRSAAKAAIA
jgi:hydroxymethylpyrimidine pyrophosphatase-like HAD family hydrolase